LELIEEQLPKNACCRRALAQGLLFCADTTGGVFSLTVPGGEIGRRVSDFLAEQLRTEVREQAFRRVGRDYVTLTLFSRQTLARLQRADMSDLPLPTLLGFDCDGCLRAFLSGFFIATASVTDPQKNYHMEFACRTVSAAQRLASLWGEVAAPPKMVRRAGGAALYYKSSAAMEDVFSYLYARRALFALMNHKIERDIRNGENRATNCVAKNIQKAVDAAGTQIAAIQRLRGSRAWDKLSSSLRETAELRLQNEDATLSELALLHQPPITKSGLNHRLKKLLEMAEQDNETTDS
jgi:DNA-binding protein WhiA